MENGQYVTHLTPRQHTTVAKLVGKRCIINCKLNELETETLWDTGAQVSVPPKRWVAEQFSGIKLRNIDELVGQGVEIELKAANGTDIPCSGWIELEFKLMSGVDVKNNCAITVPFLASPSEEVNCVILDFNVIEEMLNSNDMNDKDTAELLLSMMKASFMKKPQRVEVLVNFIQSNVLNSGDLCSVKTSKRDTLIPRGETKVVQCRANINATPGKFPVLFEPDIEPLLMSDLEVNRALLNVPGGASCKVGIQVSNSTNHDIVLKNRTVLGKLQLVKSVTPL